MKSVQKKHHEFNQQITLMKKIGIVFNGLYVGGAEKFGISLANKFVEEGTSVTLFFFRDVKSSLLDEIDPRIEKVYFVQKSKYHINFSKTFHDTINEKGIQKVFIIGLMPLLFTRIFGMHPNENVTYYLSLHSTIPKNTKTYLQNLLLLRLAKKSDHVFFICKNQQQYYKNSYFFNPPNQEVIYNGINTDHFKTSETNRLVDKRKEMNISDNGEIISLVASIRKEKGHKDAIHALFLLRKNYPNRKNTHLVFVGDGESSYVRELKELVANKGLNEFVHFEGNQKDVRPYYEVSNLFTLTSYSVETFSIAALEAMSMGLPLSLTNVGGAAEMVTEGKNGALSIPKNPLSIAESWNKILEMNLQHDNIRQIVIEKFSFDQMFAQYKEALK